MVDVTGKGDLVQIYRAVKATGLPNAIGARILVPSKLNIQAWERYLGGSPQCHNILDFVRYGFPTGYVGPVSDTGVIPNHPSASEFPGRVEAFIEKELGLDGLLGPSPEPMFHPWCHISPLMTREKGDKNSRRIITDMTFPPQHSINAFIVKNSVYGHEYNHSLPTVDALAKDVRDMGPGAYLATIDVSRAYKNFVSDPLDWPLLCFQWAGGHYCDLSMPFGSRASSFHMQSVANCITGILRKEGIHCYMYLDDLVILSPNRPTADMHYNSARGLLRELGLPKAEDKAQPPATRVKWLGIHIDAGNMTLSIPSAKLGEVIQQVHEAHSRAYITKRKLQSLLGYILYIAKCVRPARTFVSRLLTTLKACTTGPIQIDNDMRLDLEWFLQFGRDWNGVSLIPHNVPSRVILVDACLSGIGAKDGQYAYARQVTGIDSQPFNITELEAINVVVALHTFMGRKDCGSHIRIRCDNQAAVSVFSTGKAHNKVLQECARAAWMVQATLGVELSYDHIPGKDNDVADALSRAHLSGRMGSLATSLVNHYSLVCIDQCLFFISNPVVSVNSRPNHQGTDGPGRVEAGAGKGPGHEGESQEYRGDIHRVHGVGWDGPPASAISDHLLVHGVYGRLCPSTGNYPKQVVACKDVPAHGQYGF